jgi:glycosyltransferase involved in cell wall biosynthesis
VIGEPTSVCFYCADQNPHRDRSLGITNYTLGLLDSLKQNGAVQLHAVSSKSSQGVPPDIPKTVLPFRTDRVFGRLLADHFHPLLLGGKIHAQLWHYPKGFLPIGVQVRRPRVGTIADTILQFYADKYPHQRSRFDYGYWIAMLKNALRKFDSIITVSQFSKRAILEFAERYRIKSPMIHVTYQGVDKERGSNDEARSRDYLLHLASTAPHKKTNWLLEQWRRLQHQKGSLPPLRLIGGVDETGEKLIRELKDVEFLPWVQRQEIFATMRGALALILPSEIEGFGLPALEAYYCGTPVVYVKNTAVEEILGPNTPGGFTFADGSLAAGINEALAVNSPQVIAKRNELEQRFSWQHCVERTLECYSAFGPPARLT